MVSRPRAEAQVVDQRVRITQNSGITNTGRVTERSDSLLVIWDERSGQYYSISYSDVQALSVSQGMRSYARTGLISGAIAGGSLVAIACNVGCLGLGVIFVALGAAATGSVGWVVGRLFEREQWATIPIPGQAALRFEPLLGVDLAARPVIGVRLKL